MAAERGKRDGRIDRQTEAEEKRFEENLLILANMDRIDLADILCIRACYRRQIDLD